MLPTKYVDKVNSNPEPSVFDRDPDRNPFIAESWANDTLWRLVWSKVHKTFSVFQLPEANVVHKYPCEDVVRIDYVMEPDTLVSHMVWEDSLGQINIYRYDLMPLLDTWIGKSPNCSLAPDNDIVVAYIANNRIEYRVKSEDFLIPHVFTDIMDFGYSQIVGFSLADNLVKTEHTDAVLVAADEKVIYAGTDLVGFDWGTIPWDKS